MALLFLVANILYIQCTMSVTQINVTWNDDFAGYQDNGWFDESIPTNISNIHGPYHDDTYHLIRYFECSQDSLILVQYKILECDANDNQHVSLYLDGSLLSTTFVSTAKTPFTNHNLTNKFECDWMQTTINIGDGRVQFMINKNIAFKLQYTIHSNNDTYWALSDIQLQCKPLSTIDTVQSNCGTMDIVFSHLNITVGIITILVMAFCCISVPCMCLLDCYHTKKRKQKMKHIHKQNSLILSKSNLRNISPPSNSVTSPIYVSSPTSISPEIPSVYGQQLNSIQLIKENIPSPIHHPSIHHIPPPIARNNNSLYSPTNEYSFQNQNRQQQQPIQSNQSFYPAPMINQLMTQLPSVSATTSLTPQNQYDFNNNIGNQFPNTHSINQSYRYNTMNTMISVQSNLQKEEKNDEEMSKSVSDNSTYTNSTSSNNSNSKTTNSNSKSQTESQSIDMNELMDENVVDESVVTFVPEPSDKKKDNDNESICHSKSIKL